MNILKFISVLILLIFLHGCGFSVVDNNKLNEFTIIKIETDGEKRINYKLKNKILFNSKSLNKEQVVLNLNTNKKKLIKEKNIKNEVTKYAMDISSNVKLMVVNKNKKYEFTVRKTMDYSVSSKYSETLNNEKKIINLIIENLVDQILREINIKINDL